MTTIYPHDNYYSLVEKLILGNKDLKSLYFLHKLNKLNENDIVQCTYLNGIYKIININKNDQIKITSLISQNYETTIVNAHFLKKLKGNTKTIRILYEN